MRVKLPHWYARVEAVHDVYRSLPLGTDNVTVCPQLLPRKTPSQTPTTHEQCLLFYEESAKISAILSINVPYPACVKGRIGIADRSIRDHNE